MDNLDGTKNTYLPPSNEGMFVDEEWGSQFQGADVAEEPPKLSDQTIPTFPYYVVHVKNAKGGLTKGEAKTPVARIVAQVLEGLTGTEGTIIFDDLYLRTSKTTKQDGVVVPKDASDFQDDADALKAKLLKIARIGKFEKPYPTDFPGDPGTKAAGYATQFAGPGEQWFDVIVEIRESLNKYNGVEKLQNKIIWESARALDDKAAGKKAKPGTSALEEAREKIAERNRVIAGASGKDGRTAGAVSRRPGSLD